MTLNFTFWWDAMMLVEKIYWCIAIPFSVLFVIQIVLTFFGSDFDDIEADGDADVSLENDQGIGFQFISLKNLIGFFTIFGWSGIACIDGGLGLGVTVLISTASGMTMMVIMASIIYFMGKLTDDGTLKVVNAIGKVGSVYLTIPATRGGLGKVQIKVQGFRTLDAMTDHIEDIKSGSVVEVVNIISDEILLVKPSKK